MSVGTLKARELAKKKKSGFLLDDEWMICLLYTSDAADE